MARRRRARRDRADKVIGAVLAVVGVLLIAALGGGAWWLRTTKEQLDAKNCPVRSGPRAVHVIMMDRSDPISGQQAQRVRQDVDDLKRNAAFGTRFDIYTFEGDTKHEMQPELSVCAPGRPEEANKYIENPEFVRRRYEERFSAVLDRELADLLRESTRQNSPIIESLRAATITSFGPISASTIPLRVTLVSDMVQHTPAFSQFKAELSFSQLAKMQVWPSMRPDLKGAEVDVLYLLRPEATRGGKPIQTRGHQLFWEELIRASGGRLQSFQQL